MTVGVDLSDPFYGELVYEGKFTHTVAAIPGAITNDPTVQGVKVYQFGCGFSHQVTVVAFNGECIWNKIISCGHAPSIVVTYCPPDSDIKMTAANFTDQETCQGIIQEWLSWFPESLRSDEGFRDAMGI